MILDGLLQFASGQSLAAAVGTYDSTNILDFGINSGIPSSANGGGARDLGIGDDPALKLLLQVTQTFASGGAATLQAFLQGAPDNGAGAPGTFVPWWSSPVYALATLVAGERLYDMDFPRPPAGVVIPRFVKMSFTIAGATMTAGAVTSYILGDRDDQPYNALDNSILGGYRSGITIPN